MASKTEVKQYFAHWMQLGRKLVVNDRMVGMDRVIAGEHYTTLFEEIWQAGESQPEKTYLEGSPETLQDLFAATYELVVCPRCELPIPTLDMGPRAAQPCPCNDLSLWPNLETPPPRNPVQTRPHLQSIHHRLQALEA